MRGYKEEGTVTTPFDMVVRNDMDRFHLVMDVIDRVPGLGVTAAQVRQHMVDSAPGTASTCGRTARTCPKCETGSGRTDARARRERGVEQRQAPRARAARRRRGHARSRRLETATERKRDLGAFLDAAPAVDAVGHRVVHGGNRFREPVRITADVERHCSRSSPLAPLHQPRAVEGMRALGRLRPDLPQVACFDTAFHATMPAAATTYALPGAWREQWGIRRFGFHGLSHAYATTACGASSWTACDDALRVMCCHLGAGASLCATRGGRSVDTTMGWTPLEGLVMATRSGTVDPGAVLALVRHLGVRCSRARARRRSRPGRPLGHSRR